MQIVGYRPRDDEPASLTVAREGGVESEPLVPGERLSYTLEDRHCAGSIEDGTHETCDADRVPYCDRHTSRWACARCRGDCQKPLPTCDEEHAVYLAAFAPDAFKVGVTRSWRLETRLREQGADRAAHLRTVADGRIARQIESDIATEVGDRVRVPTKIAGLHRDVDEAAWSALLAEYDPVDAFAFDYGLDLRDRPVVETLATGRVVGTKGRVLVLERNGSTYAVDLRDLVGYELRAGESDRDLQASLASFG